MLERGFILPNYDFQHPNEKIPFEEWGIKVVTRQQPWPFGKRWASVNGFGFGGTNAHVIMTKGPLDRKTMKEEIDIQTSERLFILSANDKSSTEKTMQKLGVYLEQRPEVFQQDLLGNLAYTLGQRKSVHPWRVAITVSSAADLVEVLSSGKTIPTKQEAGEPRIGWIFTGQGAQWWAMGRELYEQYPVYASALEKAETHLRSIGATFSLLKELQKDEKTTEINAAHLSQPACTAVQLALVDLLQSWGIYPSAVAGHSSGEIAAAYAAGMITFTNAMTVAYHRGRLIPILKKKYPDLNGCMMAVGAGKAEITQLLDRIPDSQGEARIACINSPSSVTVAGDADAIAELQTLIEEAYPGMFARKLQVDTAYHSHHMNLVAKEYSKSLLNLETPKTSAVRFFSSLLGRPVTSAEIDASYWVQNLTCPVRFDEAIQSMCQPFREFKTGVSCLLELGPHAALQGPIKQILKHAGGPASKLAYNSVLSRGKDAVSTALTMAGALFVKGSTLNMGAINFPKPLERPPQVLTDLPLYAWNHSSSFYHESRLTMLHKHHDGSRNDILGIVAPYTNDFEPTWSNVLRLDDLPWLRHHQIQGVTILPISAFVAMALEAISQRALSHDVKFDSLEVRRLEVTAPAMLTEQELEITTTLRPCRGSPEGTLSHKFNILSWSKSKGWTEHCIGIVSAISADTNEVDGARAQQAKEQNLHSMMSAVQRAATQRIATQAVYERLSEIGVSYGATFQGLHNSQASSTSATTQIVPTETVLDMPHHEETDYIIHPTLLEQLISMYWLPFSAAALLNTVHLPSTIGKVTVTLNARKYLKGSCCSLQGFCEPSTSLSNVISNTLSMSAVGPTGDVLIAIEDLVVTPIVETSISADTKAARELCYKLEWEQTHSLMECQTETTRQAQIGAEVVIIHGESDLQCMLASEISNKLSDMTGVTPSIGPLSSTASVSKDKFCIFLAELDRPVLTHLDSPGFGALQYLLTNVQGILWVVQSAYTNSRNPDANMVTGLSRTLRSEGTLMKFVTLDLDEVKFFSATDAVPAILEVFTTVFATDSKTEETEFMERGGKLYTPRIVNDGSMNDYVNDQVHPSTTEAARFSDHERPLRGAMKIPGVPDSLIFKDDEGLLLPLPGDHVDIQVKAIGINAGDTAPDSAIGVECSGIVTAVGSDVPHLCVGDRIATIVAHGSLSTVARVPSAFTFRLPDHISFETAATIPIAFCTAAYALEQVHLSEGEMVLIHDTASAIGLAALSVAQMNAAQVWATVKTAGEKELLMREFGVPENRIWHKGSDTFAESIKSATDGRGVDVVFNTVAEPYLLDATWYCLASFGRFIDVGARHGTIAVPTGKNISFLSVDVTALLNYRPQVLQRTLRHVARLLKYSHIQALPCEKKFNISNVAAALQSAQAGGMNRRAIVVPRDDELVTVSTKSRML